MAFWSRIKKGAKKVGEYKKKYDEYQEKSAEKQIKSAKLHERKYRSKAAMLKAAADMKEQQQRYNKASGYGSIGSFGTAPITTGVFRNNSKKKQKGIRGLDYL